MQEQSEQTKELLQKEREAAKKELEEARADQDASSKEIVDKLTAENEQLKDMVSSQEQKIEETEKKYEESHKLSEERLKQVTEAESKILEMQTTMQRLQERINSMEADEQILRQQAMLTASSSKKFFSFSKGQENGHLDPQGGASMKRFDSQLRQSAIDKQRENVDILIKATTEDLGFSNGKPVVTYVIYKSLIHWKVFETEKTNVFDRLITVFGSAMQKEEDNKHMAYWLSATSTLLFLIQKSLSPSSSGKPPHPQTLFGRMTQSFRKSPSYSNLEIVRQVEGKTPALLFKQQLTAFVETIYGLVRENLKNELSQNIACCIQSAREKGNTPPSMYWQHIIESLNGMLKTLEEYHVPTILDQKIFAQVFSYINVQLFNSLLLRRECCSFSNGEYLKSGLAELELWCSHATEEYADSSWDELKHTRQAVGFLVIHQKSKIEYNHLITELCPILSVQQLYKICTHYADDIYKTPSVSSKVISTLKEHTEGSENADNTSFLLEDDPCIPFSVDDLVNFLHEKDFAEMKPTCYLVDNPDFKFLVE